MRPAGSETRDAGGPIVRLIDVWVWLGDTLALRDVSLDIERGRFIGLMGPNGGGKTTLLKTIVGLIRPDRGKVILQSPVGKTVGYVPQEEYIDPEFPVTAYDVVEMGLYGSLGVFPRTTGKHRAQVQRALDLVGMSEHAGRGIGTLSGGEKQRVSIARAVVGRPSLLLLDEPTTGVDADARDDFYRTLQTLRRSLSLTIILASHDIEAVPTQVDEVVCINQRVYVHAAPEEIKDIGDFRKAYGCELEFIAHGRYPHRVLEHHSNGTSEEPEGSGDA